MSTRLHAMPEAEDRERLPVAILTGALGSGKTTLLNALLHDPRLADTAVAINEFGDVPLDQHLIDHGDDKTVVMANGCLCCNLAGDMEQAVMRVFSRRQSGELPQFSRLIVEPSGLADPAPIVQAILRNPVLSRFLRLDTIVATVDALFGGNALRSHQESRKQAAMADRIVVTKTDLVAPEDVVALAVELVQINPNAPRVDGHQTRSNASGLFSEHFFEPSARRSAIAQWLEESKDRFARRATPTSDGHAHHAHADATSASMVCAAPLVWREFEAWLRRIRIDWSGPLLRVKGILNVEESPLPLVVQGVHHVLHPPVALERWPSRDHRSRIVFITQGSASREILESWEGARERLCAREDIDLARETPA
jgi:G3E family GTPase